MLIMVGLLVGVFFIGEVNAFISKDLQMPCKDQTYILLVSSD